MPFSLTLSLAALAIEAAFGYPAIVYRLIGHPVTWIGALLSLLENVLNRGKSFFARRLLGILALSLLLAPTALVSIAIGYLLPENLAGGLVLAILASSLVAQRSLDQHVRAVA